MTYLLDTNSCIAVLRKGAASAVTAKLSATAPGGVALCSIVVAELLYGARRSNQPAKNLAEVYAFCGGFISLPFDDSAAEEYGIIRAHLVDIGMTIGPNDLLIASIATTHHLTLVTHNVSEFARVPGLAIEDWQIF